MNIAMGLITGFTGLGLVIISLGLFMFGCAEQMIGFVLTPGLVTTYVGFKLAFAD